MPSDLDEYPPEFRRCYGAHQAFIKLGIDPARLFIALQDGHVLVALIPVGVGRTADAVIDVGPTQLSENEFDAKWSLFLHAMNVTRTLTMEMRQAMWQEFYAGFNAVEFIKVLVFKGYHITPLGLN